MFKQDYEIIVKADINGTVYFTVKYKGETLFIRDKDSLNIINSMLKEVTNCIDNYIKQVNDYDGD